jgi:hypothetical protein
LSQEQQDQNDPVDILFKALNDFHQDLDPDRARRTAMKKGFDIALLTLIGVLGAAQAAASQTAQSDAGPPAIDAAAPAAFETATFALG